MRQPYKAAAIKDMAAILNLEVPELANNADCEAALELAGFHDWQIFRYLDDAREMARSMRIEEIERLSREQRR